MSLDDDCTITTSLTRLQAMKKAEKAKLNSYLSEVDEIQAEESIYFKLEPGKSETVQYVSYERLDKTVDWGDGEKVEDTFRLNILNKDEEEKVFDRRFGHNFTKAVLPLLINNTLKPNQMVELKRATGKYGEYMLIPIVEDELVPTPEELDEILEG